MHPDVFGMHHKRGKYTDMPLKKIIESFGQLEVTENRCVSDEFIELVFLNKDLSAWHRILSDTLGFPVKPQGQTPSAKDLELTSKTGGIRIEQTLFEREFDEGTVIGKFWPWKDNKHTTLRMALLLKG